MQKVLNMNIVIYIKLNKILELVNNLWAIIKLEGKNISCNLPLVFKIFQFMYI